MSNRLWACVPVKDLSQAKQRLAGVLSQPDRSRLAQAMLLDVLDAVQSTPGLAGIALLTADPFAQCVARARGLRIIEDAATEGHTAVANAAMRSLAHEGVEAALMLPADVPLVTANELDALAASPSQRRFTIVPSHDRDGSNAVVCAPPGLVSLRYGADSFTHHLRAARALGIEPEVVELPGISRDVDHPRDLAFIIDSSIRTRAQALLLQLCAQGVLRPETIRPPDR